MCEDFAAPPAAVTAAAVVVVVAVVFRLLASHVYNFSSFCGVSVGVCFVRVCVYVCIGICMVCVFTPEREQ